MPDFNNRLSEIRRNREEAQGKTPNSNQVTSKVNDNGTPKTTEQMFEEKVKGHMEERQNPPEQKKQLNFGATDWKTEGVSAEQQGMRENTAEQSYGGDQSEVKMNADYVDPNAWGTQAVYQNLMDKSVDNVLVGTGNLIAGLGDTVDGLLAVSGGDSLVGNPFSEMLKDVGNTISENNTTYIPEDIMNPEFKLSTFMNPEFWAVHGAQFVPQLVEIMITKNIARAGSKLVSKVGKEIVEEGLERGLKKSALKGLTATTKGVRGTVSEVAGTGRGMGKLMRDTGELTNLGSGLTQTVLGGGLTNLKVSLQNSGEVYNTFKDYKNEDGSPAFTKEELGAMASSTFTNNMSYMGVDMLSWGMSFGGGWKALGKGMKNASTTLSPAVQRKVTGALFSKGATPLLARVAKFTGKGVSEGFEETVQESWEEWSKYAAYKKVAGTGKGFPGMTENHNSFWDYYHSQDAEAIKAISFGLGMGAGGAFNLKTLVDKQANQMAELQDRSENLKNRYEKGTNGQAYQDYHVKQQMAELVHNDKEEHFVDFMQTLESKGVLDDTQIQKYSDLFSEMKQVKNEIGDLNIVGKQAYLNTVVAESDVISKIDIETNKHNKNLAILQDQLNDDPKALAKATDKQEQVYKKQMTILANMLSQHQGNKKKILVGDPATKVDFETAVDENGNEIYVEPTTENSEEVQKEEAETAAPKMIKSAFTKMNDQAKKALESIGLGDLFGDSKGEIDVNTKEEVAEEVVPQSTEFGELEKSKLLYNAQTDSSYLNNENLALEKELAEIDVDNDSRIAEIDAQMGSNEEQISLLERKDTLGKELSEIKENNSPRAIEINNELSEIEAELKPVQRTKWEDTDKGKQQTKLKPQQPKVENPNIIKDDAKTQLDNDAYQEFLDKGVIASGVINAIANDISNGKKLTVEQQAVRNEFNEEIEQILNEKLKVQKDVENNVDKDFDMNDPEQVAQANYQKRALARKAKMKKLDDTAADFKKTLDKTVQKAKGKIESVFGIGRSRKLDPNTIIDEATKQAQNLADRAKSAFYMAKNSYNEFKSQEDARKGLSASLDIKNNNLYQFEKDALKLSQSVAINERLGLMFPDADIHVSAVEDLANVIGLDSMGYTLSGAIYIDANSWNQDNVFMHEMSHIYYDLMKNDPNTSVIINNALKNKDLLTKVKSNYADDIVYKNKKNQSISLGALRERYLNDPRVLSDNFEEEFAVLLANGSFVEAPIEEQEVIREEMFAYYLEGPLSAKYDKFFEPKEENVRQFLTKKWWSKIKNKAENAEKLYNKNENIFLNGLSDKKVEEFSSAKEFVMSQFMGNIKGRNIDLSASGKSKAKEVNQKLLSEQLEAIENRYEQESKNIGVKPEQFDDVLLSDIADDLDSDINSEHFFEVNRMKYVRKASKYISLFSKNYNQVLRRKFYLKNKDKAVDWRTIKPFDKDMLMIKIMQIAKESASNVDFINKIQNSDVEEISEFNDFLEQIRPNDKTVVLSSMKFIYGNQSSINSVIGHVNEDGVFELQNNLNNKEVAQSEYIFQKFNDGAFSYFNSLNPDNGFPVVQSKLDSYAKLISAIEKIKSGQYKEIDLYNFLEFFSSPDMDIQSIMKENRINIDGKNFTIDTVVNEVIKKNFTEGKNPYGVYENDKKGQYKSIVRKFVQSLIATNRKFTAEYTVKNANEKQEPIRVVDNMLTRQLEKMNIDANKLSRAKFIKKYASITNEGKGSKSNPILNYMYDRAIAGEKIDLNQFHGIKNQQTKNSSVISDSNSTEQSIFESVSYMSDNSASYMMETGRYSDSPTSYMMRVPKIKLSDLGSVVNGKFVFGKNSKSVLDNAHATFNKLNGKQLTLNEFAQSISREIEQEIEFTNENNEAFMKMKNMQKYFNEKGELNKDGRQKVAEYSVNQIINGIAYNDIFFPSFKLNDIVKRQKSGRSPGFRLGKGVQVEPIYYVDDFVNGQSVSDSSMYVLKEDADLIRKAGGDMMPLNNSYKILMTGVEYDNPNFANKNLFDKGYATILDAEMVAKNPRLKGLYELMKSRRQNYVDKMGPIQSDLLNGIPTHLMYAAPVSSIKSGNTPIKMVQKDENGNESSTEEGQQFTLDSMNTLNFEEQNKTLDGWHYDGDNFMGLSSDNFVVQQVMDKESYDANAPVQMVRAILTNGSVEGSLEIAEEIQSLIAGQQQEVLSKYKEVMKSNNPIAIREFIKSHMALDDLDSTQKFLVNDDLLSMSTPALRELAKNTLANAIRVNGNKLRTPGGIAQAKAATYQKPYKTNGSNQLEFYGTKEVEKDGKMVTVHTKGEAVLPAFMNKEKGKKGKLTARKYFVQDSNSKENNSIAILERMAKAEARKRGVDFKEMYNDRGVLIGFYAEGDTFIATRIPSHGPQTTGVFEVVDFDTSGASNIQLPSEFALDITGGDFDGDQFFVQHKGGTKMEKWNNAFDKLTDLWLSEKMFSEVRLPIDFQEEAKAAVKIVNEALGKKEVGNFHFSPKGRRTAYNNTLVSKKNIGVSANLHSLISMLSAYETDLITPIKINGVKVDKFHDVKGESRTINSAKIFNLILDNAKNQFADTLGINEHTISSAMILRNLGFSLADIGLIMNSQSVTEMNRMLSNNENVFKDKKSMADLEKQVRMKLGRRTSKVDLNTNELKGDNKVNAEHAVLDLMMNLGTINEEIMNISGIMQGHNKLDNNPFILNQQKEKFLETMVSSDNKGIKVPAGLTQNPLVQNYLDVFNFNLEVMKEMDPVYNATGVKIFEKLTEGITRNLTDNDIRKIHNDIEKLMTARSLGLNNVDEEYMLQLVNSKNPNNIFNRFDSYLSKQASTLVEIDYDNEMNSINALENNMLLRRGLRYSLKGNTQYISLNNNFFNENMSNEERNRMIDEFNALPQDLQNDLLVYDMFTHGLKGPQSLFHIMDKSFKQEVSDASTNTIKNDQDILSGVQSRELLKRIAQTNSSIFKEVKGEVIVDGAFAPKFISENSALINNMIKGKETIFKYVDKSGKPKIFHFMGWNNNQIAELKNTNPKDRASHSGSMIANSKNVLVYDADKYNNGIGVISIKDSGTGSPTKLSNKATLGDIDVTDADSDFSPGRSRKEIASDYYNYTQTLTKEQLIDVLQVNRNNVDNERQNSIYAKYLESKKKADAVSKTINSESVKAMSDEKLVELYSGKKLNDGEMGYGHRDKIAYAKVIRPIILEIANRAGVEQSKLAKGRSGAEIGYDGNDIGYMHSFLMSNNIPSNQPEIQSLVRKMEIEYKRFQNEKTTITKSIQSATENLYKEQFGKAPKTLVGKFFKSLNDALFQNKEDMYMKLYGPLIEFQEVTDDSGRKITNMKYKPKEAIESGYADGSVSKGQYDFYNATREMTEKLKPFSLGKDERGRQDYIPHTAPAWLEIKARRGMLGLAVNSKTLNERVFDVRMKFTNPLTKQVEDNASFQHIENVYNILSKQNNGKKEAIEFLKLKKRAIVLAKQMKNEDGSALRLSEVEAGSSIGDVFMDRFSNSRSVASTDLPSLDLNKAFMDYAHSALFNHGNENFSGMNKQLPLVEGILALTDARKDVNSKKYVEKVWKTYFLGGKKQDSKLPNSATLEAVGISTDNVIDYLTKGSLIYWLGYKGLAVAGGAYAIGNVLAGKYMNIKNNGGVTWALGEKRFWSGQKFSILNPFKGVQESSAILKNAGFMDINVYDNVSMEDKSSMEKTFMNIALMPMIYSEKWIQGVDFLGRLTEQEWDILKDGGKIDDARMTELEDQVKINHGKGYQATDQRMLQMYSWGRNMLQFSRYIPTLFYDQFAKGDIDIYGKEHIGSYRAVGKYIQKVVRGEVSVAEMFKYRDSLSAYERKRFNQGLIGFGMLAVFQGLNVAGHEMGDRGFFADANPLLDADKMLGKISSSPTMNMVDSLL